MDETTLEPIDPVTPETVEVMPLDPIHEIHILREINRRWRRAAIGSILVAVFLGIVSVVQFAGTFITCRLLNKTREEAASNREIAEQRLRELRIVEEKTGDTMKLVALVCDQVTARNAMHKVDLIKGSDRFMNFHKELQQSEMKELNRMRAERRKLLEQVRVDVAETRENLMAVETMRILLEKDEEAPAHIDPRTYADPRQRCPYLPGGKPPMPE